MSTPKLTIELVPKTCWFSNVRSEVSKAGWDKIKKIVSDKAGARCEICGGRGPKWPVECHEIWHYDDQTYTQTLTGMVALCPDCHEVKHIGFAQTKGRLPQAAEHLMRVNGWDPQTTMDYIAKAFNVWAHRSQHPWKLDISHLDTYGITPMRRAPR